MATKNLNNLQRLCIQGVSQMLEQTAGVFFPHTETKKNIHINISEQTVFEVDPNNLLTH